MSKLEADFTSTKKDLGNTELKLKGLISMEKKCEELYVEIKMEKERWDSFNFTSNQEKENLEKEVTSFKQEAVKLTQKIADLE